LVDPTLGIETFLEAFLSGLVLLTLECELLLRRIEKEV
jgi:hypothetical protein